MSKFISLLLILVLLAPQVYAASSSANYRITIDVLDAGGTIGAASSSYTLSGKGRDHALSATSSTNYKIGEGFFRAVFGVFAPLLGPIVTSINPSSASNDKTVATTITGANFQPGATTKLTKAGEADIIGTGVTVLNPNTITCSFDLKGKASGAWNVVVINPDLREGILPYGFTIEQAPLEVVGPVLNFPNPFDPDKQPTIIKYTLTANADITLNLYNLKGDRIYSIKYGAGRPGGQQGENAVEWDGSSSFGWPVPNGVYILQVVSKGRTLATSKIAVLR